ncbi:hypothetical protein GCM10009838_14110 [Catenulispora subtropica]|uniref:Uncharacterized protein n=1 Tax=Catenulispora subtropica TaxID=450798 RepID=A0ABP5C906_9ACTN
MSMREGTCSSCGATEVYYALDGLKPGRGVFGGVSLRGTVMNTPTDVYICVACGYIAQYVQRGDSSLKTVAKKWRRVSGPKDGA